MKIVFISPKIAYSGAPKMMTWIANQMANRGHDVEIIVAYKSKIEQNINEKVIVKELNINQSKKWLFRNTIGALNIVKQYKKEIKSYKPDIIVSFLDSISYLFIFLNKLLWHYRIIVSERVDPYNRNGWKSNIRFKISKMADYSVFQTENARDYFKNDYKEKSTVIGNPVVITNEMTNVLKMRKEKKFTRKNTIVSVGRLNITQKRQDVLIKAFNEFLKKHNNYDLYIYGDGSDREKIVELINKMSLNEKVHLMGRQEKILEKIYDSACFVLTSDFEGIPNALIEAMSIGLPCISTDCSPGGARMLIKDGENGFIVDRNDYIGISRKLEYIIDNPEKIKTIEKEAMKISNLLSEKSIADKWEQTFMLVTRR